MSTPSTTSSTGKSLPGQGVPARRQWKMGDAFVLEAEYPPEVRTKKSDELPPYLLRTLNLIRPQSSREITALPAAIADLKPQEQRWLLYAMLLMAVNRKTLPGFDYLGAVVWLIKEVVKTGPALPDGNPFFFEFQVLGRTGWIAEAMWAKLKPLSSQDKDAVKAHYKIASPTGTSTSTGLNEAILRQVMGHLTDVLKEERETWGMIAAQQPIDQLRPLADFVQLAVWSYFRPYVAARTDGPFASGFCYGGKLYDKTGIYPTEEHIYGYLFNRLKRVGEDEKYGSIFARAGYDDSNPGHREVLRKIAGDWLKEDELERVELVSFLVRHTASASHGTGEVGMVTDLPSGMSHAKYRWRNVRTLLHELGHVLMHPNLRQAAARIPSSQVISEGFVEVMTCDLYNSLLPLLTPGLKDRFLLGIKGREDPEKTTVGYGAAGKAALEIYRIVGRDRFFMAFFNGDIEYVGL